MKKLIIFVLIPFIISGCTVQEKVSAEIYLERLIRSDENVAADESFRTEDAFVSFISYGGADFVLKLTEDKNLNVAAISLTCADGGKSEMFRSIVKSIISSYCADDADEIINELFGGKDENGGFRFHSTQWFDYSAVISGSGLYFSLENKKLIGETEEKLSLEHKKGAVSP